MDVPVFEPRSGGGEGAGDRRSVGSCRMRFVVTLMVRDEADIIAAFVEHHLAQGADLIIATDNGSVDGTTEVLQRYADLGVLELHHDPVFRKQQHAVVTGMARRAFTEHGADWVINADADEFWVPCDKRLTLRSALEAIPTSLETFTVPVTNLVGPPAMRGSGVDRLALARHADPGPAPGGRHLRPADRRRHPSRRSGRRGRPGQSLRLAQEHRPARSGVRARGPPPAVAVVAPVRASRRQHGALVRGEPRPASEQEPPWDGRLSAASRRPAAVRVPRPPPARAGPRRRRGRGIRARHLAARPPARARRSGAPARSACREPRRRERRSDRPRSSTNARRPSAACSSRSSGSGTRRAGWPTGRPPDRRRSERTGSA